MYPERNIHFLIFSSGKRAVGDAGPYKVRPYQSLPLEGEVAFAKQMTVGGRTEAGTRRPPSVCHAGSQLPLMGSLCAGNRKGRSYGDASVGP